MLLSTFSLLGLWKVWPGWRDSLNHRVEQSELILKDWPSDPIPRNREWSGHTVSEDCYIKASGFQHETFLFLRLFQDISCFLWKSETSVSIRILFSWQFFCLIWQWAYWYKSTETNTSFFSKEERNVLKRILSTTEWVFPFLHEEIMFNIIFGGSQPCLYTGITWEL